MRNPPASFPRRPGAALFLVALAWLFVAGAAGAQASAPQAAASGPAGEGRNIYEAGGQVRPAGPVQGDFTAAGARVILDQPVGGDATVAGGSVDVRAPVADDVRAAGGDVSVESTVGGELFATGGHITLTRGARVARGATLYGSSITVGGRIEGDLKASGQEVTIDGEVGGNVRVVAARLALGPGARIAGTLTYDSASELERAAGAVVGGTITHERASPPPPGRGEPRSAGRTWEGGAYGPAWAAGLVGYLALLACAAVFLLVAPGFTAQASDRAGQAPWLALAIGFAAFVAVPMLAVLLFITLLGIPLALAVLALYPVLLLTGFVVGVLFIARRIPPAIRQPAPVRFGRMIAYFALALLLVLLLGRLPFVGAALVGVLSLLGMGACVLEAYRRRQDSAAA